MQVGGPGVGWINELLKGFWRELCRAVATARRVGWTIMEDLYLFISEESICVNIWWKFPPLGVRPWWKFPPELASWWKFPPVLANGT